MFNMFISETCSGYYHLHLDLLSAIYSSVSQGSVGIIMTFDDTGHR